VIAYFDTSALLKLVIAEDGADQAELLWQSVGEVVVSRLAWPEAVAALAAAQRGRRLTDEIIAPPSVLCDCASTVAPRSAWRIAWSITPPILRPISTSARPTRSIWRRRLR